MATVDASARFAEAVRENAPRLLALARLILDDEHEAEDVVQETFLKAWDRWEDPEIRERALPWLLRVVRNRCIDLRRGHHPRVGLDGIAEAPTIAPGEPSRIGQWTLDQILPAIRRLPEPHATVLLLRFSQKLSYDAIAETMKSPLGTIKSQISRALKLLRTDLEGATP